MCPNYNVRGSPTRAQHGPSRTAACSRYTVGKAAPEMLLSGMVYCNQDM